MFRIRKIAALALALGCAAWNAAFAGAPRGKVLGELMGALELPVKSGRTFTDVSGDTPYAKALESALSLGILYPADDFEPDIPCTNAETLMFALQAMGFRHEAETALWAVPPADTEGKPLPEYVAGYVALARTITPAAPASLTDDPWGTTSDEQLAEVLNWAASCRQKVVWDRVITIPEGTLRMHRENVGRPPHGWHVQLGVFDSREQAEEYARGRTRDDCPLRVEAVDTSFAVVTPTAAASDDAWEMARKFIRDSSDFSAVVQPDAGDSTAIFWASFVPANAGDVTIRMNRADSDESLGLLSEIAGRSGAAVAMNAGYFASFGPIGTLFSGGVPLTPPFHNRSMIAWDKKGRLHFGGGEYRASLTVADRPPVDVIFNSRIDLGATGVVTPALGRSKQRAGNNGTIASVVGGRVVEVTPGLAFNRDLSPDEWLVITRDANMTLAPGDTVRLDTHWSEAPSFAVECAVQGGPLLFAPNREYSDEKFSPSIITMRHPRTMIGSDGKRMVWIVVDGRSSWHSTGLTIQEAADFGRQMGLTALLNLDGGGSTELIFGGHVVNRLADGHERKMPYGLVIPKK